MRQWMPGCGCCSPCGPCGEIPVETFDVDIPITGVADLPNISRSFVIQGKLKEFLDSGCSTQRIWEEGPFDIAYAEFTDTFVQTTGIPCGPVTRTLQILLELQNINVTMDLLLDSGLSNISVGITLTMALYVNVFNPGYSDPCGCSNSALSLNDLRQPANRLTPFTLPEISFSLESADCNDLFGELTRGTAALDLEFPLSSSNYSPWPACFFFTNQTWTVTMDVDSVTVSLT